MDGPLESRRGLGYGPSCAAWVTVLVMRIPEGTRATRAAVLFGDHSYRSDLYQ